VRFRAGITLILSSILFSLPSGARADQTRDFMIAAPENGTFAFLDLIFPGIQTGIEQRVPIYGNANQLVLRANALYLVPFYESQADVDLRLLVLTLGASAGFRYDFRSLEFQENERLDRHYRRIREIDGRATDAFWGFGEVRATLSLPINDYVLANGINTYRGQGSPDRTFDWRNGIVHDGTLFRSDIMLFFKHPDIGGIAPLWQILNFELGNKRYTQFNYGFMAVTRPGFMRANDILLLQVLIHPGSTLGGYDNSFSYGSHLFYQPFTFLVAYRMILPIWRPE
jgi:hypothetical protein